MVGWSCVRSAQAFRCPALFLLVELLRDPQSSNPRRKQEVGQVLDQAAELRLSRWASLANGVNGRSGSWLTGGSFGTPLI